jgi:hypothetical protein
MLKKGNVSTGLIWPKSGTSGRLLWTQEWTCRFHRRWRFFWMAFRLLRMPLIHGVSNHFFVALFRHWLGVIMLFIYQKSLVVTVRVSYVTSFIEIIHIFMGVIPVKNTNCTTDWSVDVKSVN